MAVGGMDAPVDQHQSATWLTVSYRELFVTESCGYLSGQFAKNHSHLVNSLAG